MTDPCTICGTRPATDGRGRCRPCFDERVRQAARETVAENLRALAADFGCTPPRLDELAIDDHNRDAILEIRGLDDPDADQKTQTLILHGPVGTGKTTIAAAIARDWIENSEGDCRARFTNLRELIAAKKSAMTRNQDVDPIQDLLDDDPDLLILDDLGAERPTPFAVDEIGRIVENRTRPHQHRVGFLIVTTNYPPSKLAARLGGDELLGGQRIVSRLRNRALIIRIAGPDRRGKDLQLTAGA